MRLPPTVRQEHSCLAFGVWGAVVTDDAAVGDSMIAGDVFEGYKKMVSVPFSQLPTPCARRLSLSAYECTRVGLVVGSVT
jgi:hypothetical protein